MLVLVRKLSESIIIGPDRNIEVKVLSVRGDRVSIGIEAPRYVPVFRSAVLERIHGRGEPAWIRQPLELAAW